jgi:hypothetical protein
MVRDGTDTANAVATWDAPDARCRAAYANEIDTTEWGAYACALAAVELRRGLVAVHRAHTKSGADYYLAPSGNKLEDLEEAIRLEISGSDDATTQQMEARLCQKVDQSLRGKGNLPAMATVVGFHILRILITDVC